LLFELAEAPSALGLEVFDQDRDADDLIGSYTLALGASTLGKNPWSTEKWLQIHDQKGKTSGKARVALFWEPAPMPQWGLDVHVLECADLSKADLFSKNDVFVTAAAAGQQRRTTTIDNGGSAPVWGNGVGDKLSWQLAAAPTHLDVAVWDADVGSADDEIGTCEVSLAPCAIAAASTDDKAGWESEGWFEINRKGGRGNSAGRVRLRLSWSRLRGVFPTSQQSFQLSPTSLGGHDSPQSLLAADKNGRMGWGSSHVFRVDDCGYQKLRGTFYDRAQPQRKLATFVAGLRHLPKCTDKYVDSWVTVHRPPPQLLLRTEWEHIPAGTVESSGICRLTIVEVLGLDFSAAAEIKSGLRLRCKVGKGIKPFKEIDLDSSGGTPSAVITVRQLGIARRIRRTERVCFEVWHCPATLQKTKSQPRMAPRKLLTFAGTLDGALAPGEHMPTMMALDVDPSEGDALRLEARRQFDDIDEDGSGFLDQEEVRRLSRVMGAPLGNAELRTAMAEIGGPGTQEVSFDMFYNWFVSQNEQPEGTGLRGLFSKQKARTRSKAKSLVSKGLLAGETSTARQAFDMLDTDGSGTLSRAEIRDLSRMMGKAMSDDELDLAMSEMGGGGLSTQEQAAQVSGRDAADTIARQHAAARRREMEAEVSFEQFSAWWTERGQHGGGVMGSIRNKLGSGFLSGVLGAGRRKKQQQAIAERADIKEAFDFIDTDASGCVCYFFRVVTPRAHVRCWWWWAHTQPMRSKDAGCGRAAPAA
jgi:Ca2+-binding EF-hand superfamily protein